MNLKGFILYLALCLTVSCNVKSKPISYGKDHCHFCEMTVVDQNHATFYITKKGKQFNFDAIECMINDLKNKEEADLAFMEVTHYGHPKQMIPAQEAYYLVSLGIKSPMGENLSAFSTIEEVEKAQEEYGGGIYTWSEIKILIRKK